MTEPSGTPPFDPVGQGNGSPQPQGANALSPDQDKLYASLAHFLNIILLVPALIIYLVFKDRGPRVNTEGKEALNWTINVTGAVVAVNILTVILGLIPILGWILGILFNLVLWALLIVNLVFAIIGGMRVNSGGSYRYPFNIRWIK